MRDFRKLTLAGSLAMSLISANAAADIIVLDTIEWEGSTYSLLSASTWVNAQNFAMTLGGNLATVTTVAENDFLYGLWGQNGSSPNHRYVRLFIGLSDAENEGVFKWASGDVFDAPTQFNFSVNEPNGGTRENYVHLWEKPGALSQFGWNDHTGSQQYVSIMEVRSSSFTENANALTDVSAPLGLGALGLLGFLGLRRKRDGA